MTYTIQSPGDSKDKKIISEWKQLKKNWISNIGDFVLFSYPRLVSDWHPEWIDSMITTKDWIRVFKKTKKEVLEKNIIGLKERIEIFSKKLDRAKENEVKTVDEIVSVMKKQFQDWILSQIKFLEKSLEEDSSTDNVFIKNKIEALKDIKYSISDFNKNQLKKDYKEAVEWKKELIENLNSHISNMKEQILTYEKDIKEISKIKVGDNVWFNVKKYRKNAENELKRQGIKPYKVKPEDIQL